MKKFLISAAVLAVMATSCVNDEIVNSASDGQMFTLKVSQGIGSRTALSDNQIVWSQGDKIYVTSADGKVTGILTLKEGVSDANGEFEGWIFGGDPEDLDHIVFPVPENGRIPMGKTSTADKLDIPMTGSVADGQLNIVGGLIKLPVTAGANVKLNVKNGETEVLCGYYEFDSNSGKLTFVPDPEGTVTITVPANGVVLLPVATDNVQGVAEDELKDEVSVVVNDEVAVVAPVEEGAISEKTVPEVEVGEEGEISTKVDTEARLVSAIVVGGYIKLDATIELKNPLVIAENSEVELDLNGYALNGEIENNGTLKIVDSSEVYKREASDLSVETAGSATTNVMGGAFTSNEALTPAKDYSLVANGEQWVVLPTASVYFYNSGQNADANGKNLDAMMIAAADGSTIYVTAGNYEFNHISGVGDVENQTLTIVGLDGAKIIGTSSRPYGFRISSDYEEVVNIKNFEIECPDNYSAIYVKGNAVVNLYDLRINTGIHLDVASALPTSSLCAKHTYNNGEKDVTTTWAPEGTKAVVNAYNVTSTIEDGEIWADLLTMPCFYNAPYNELTMRTTTIAEFNYEGGDVKGAFANGITRSEGDNMFVNGIALPAYQAPTEDAE